MKTNWIILVSSLAFPIKMEIIFAGGGGKRARINYYYCWRIISNEK